MRVEIIVVPNAKVEQIQESLESGHLKVWVRGKPVEGEANRSVLNLLSKHFGVTKNQIKISHGQKSRRKIIEISL